MTVFYYRSKALVSPLVMLWSAWCVTFFVYLAGPVQYSVEFSYPAFLYGLTLLLCFSLGYYFRSELVSNESLGRERASDIHSLMLSFSACKIYLSWSAIFGYLSAALFLYDSYISGRMGGDFAEIRAQFVHLGNISIYRQLAFVFAAGGVVSFVSALLLWPLLSNIYRNFLLCSGVSITVMSIFSGGRQVVFMLILAVIASSLVRPYRLLGGASYRSLRRIQIIFIALAVAYGVMVGVIRNDQKGVRKSDILLTMFQAKERAYASFIKTVLPMAVYDGIMELSVYFGHEYPMYFLFWDSGWTNGPYYGLWELPFVSRRIDTVIGSHGLTAERAELVGDEFISRTGYYPNVWMTGIRDLLLDFGYVGAVVFVTLVGYFSAAVMNWYRSKKTVGNGVLLVVVDIGLLYSPLFSEFKDTIYFFTMLISVFYVLTRKVRLLTSGEVKQTYAS